MHHRIRRQLLAGLVGCLSLAALGAAPAGAVNQTAVIGAVTRTFSFIASPNGKAGKAIVNINGLLMNARCDASGRPIVFAFSSANAADLFGRVFDGAGRVNVVHNTVFNRTNRGVLVSPSRNDFNSTGSLLFENVNGRVVTVNIAMDNSTTLDGRRVCTVFGSWIAS